MVVTSPERKTEKLDLRLSVSAKNTLRMAATASGRKIAEFVLESAMERAKETLPDRQLFGLNAKQWAAFQAALDKPPRDVSRLARVLRKPGVFETGF
ncbi:MAG: DUF1778 domain-containing protein [Acidobacteriaceae bacterium]|nr:DUF1778 domain-containing protein [Acidobacteriaceae bacterium]